MKQISSFTGALDRLRALLSSYYNVEIVVSELSAPNIAQPIDLVWMSYHDLHNDREPISAPSSGRCSARFGRGIYYVEDHSAPGTGIAATSLQHRSNPQAVRGETGAAAFLLKAESQLIANPAHPRSAEVERSLVSVARAPVRDVLSQA